MLAGFEAKLSQLEHLTTGSLPTDELVMRAFSSDPKQIKVVLLGQDPYPTPGDAIGLAFAISRGQKQPRSLVNIRTELVSDLGIEISEQLDLSQWQERGVMLLNTSLTTQAHKPGSHSKLGWQEFTKAALLALASAQSFVILAWGNHAKELANSIKGNVIVIESAHPSPLSASRGFLGSKPFSRANAALESLGLPSVDWSL